MSKSAFTKGPWEPKTKAQWESGFDFFSGADGAFVFMADVDECDIPLISAAPDLYEALKACRLELDYCADQLSYLGRVGGEDGSVATALRKATAALAKASPFNKEGE